MWREGGAKAGGNEAPLTIKVKILDCGVVLQRLRKRLRPFVPNAVVCVCVCRTAAALVSSVILSPGPRRDVL